MKKDPERRKGTDGAEATIKLVKEENVPETKAAGGAH